MALRSDLVGLLAAASPTPLRTGVAVTGVDGLGKDRPARVFTTEGELEADLVVAADGIQSLIRAALFPMHPGPRYSGFTAWRFVTPTDGPGPVEPSETWGGALCSASSRSLAAGGTATPAHRRRRACVTMTRPPSWCGGSAPGMIRFPA